MTRQWFFIFWACCVVGGGIVFGIYYLLYTLTVKKKYDIKSRAFLVKVPLIIGFINLVALLGCTPILIILAFGPVRLLIPDNSIFLFLVKEVLIIILACYLILAVPLSIGSIAVSFVFYKRKLIIKGILLSVVLRHSIYIVIIFIIYYVMVWMPMWIYTT